jgi:NAD(P)-dependent dehydrogenase (short-subunit alcohol dehydrogenase family)
MPELNKYLAGKVVLVTGANGGLGTAVTHAFLDAGARVAGTSMAISDSDFANPSFSAFPASIATADDALALVKSIEAKVGRVEILVHLVGAFTGGKSIGETPSATFDKMFDVNFRAALYMIQAVLPGMQANKQGSVVAIGSRTAVEPTSSLGAYSASKAALVSLVRTLALEGKADGITSNVVLPGTMDTPGNRKAMPSVDPGTWVQPKDVAAMLVQLVSNRSVTGAVVPIYGGEL